MRRELIKTIAFASEIYLIKKTEIQVLPIANNISGLQRQNTKEIIVFLDEKNGDVLLNGAEQVVAAEDEFVPVRFAYASYSAPIAFFIHIAKYIKRRFYIRYPSIYTTKLSSLLDNNIIRGERNEQNAYQWTNKKWKMSREEAHERYQKLYDSIKTNGYDATHPMLIALNRKYGVKDQMLQGHHRISICKQLDVQDVAISFWAIPRSFNFMKIFIRKK